MMLHSVINRIMVSIVNGCRLGASSNSSIFFSLMTLQRPRNYRWSANTIVYSEQLHHFSIKHIWLTVLYDKKGGFFFASSVHRLIASLIRPLFACHNTSVCTFQLGCRYIAEKSTCSYAHFAETNNVTLQLSKTVLEAVRFAGPRHPVTRRSNVEIKRCRCPFQQKKMFTCSL